MQEGRPVAEATYSQPLARENLASQSEVLANQYDDDWDNLDDCVCAGVESGNKDKTSHQQQISKLVNMSNENLTLESTQTSIALKLGPDETERQMKLHLNAVKKSKFDEIGRNVPENGYVETDEGHELQYSEEQKQRMDRVKQKNIDRLKSLYSSINKAHRLGSRLQSANRWLLSRRFRLVRWQWVLRVNVYKHSLF